MRPGSRTASPSSRSSSPSIGSSIPGRWRKPSSSTTPAQSTMLSPQQLIDAAKAPMLAYNQKDWNAVRAGITQDFIYDEVGTRRKVQGADQTITLFQGWAEAIPDSKATFDNAVASGNTVLLELTWRGTHKGPLQTPKGSFAATGKQI